MTIEVWEVGLQRKVVRTKEFDSANAVTQNKVVTVVANNPSEAWDNAEKNSIHAGWNVWSVSRAPERKERDRRIYYGEVVYDCHVCQAVCTLILPANVGIPHGCLFPYTGSPKSKWNVDNLLTPQKEASLCKHFNEKAMCSLSGGEHEGEECPFVQLDAPCAEWEETKKGD